MAHTLRRAVASWKVWLAAIAVAGLAALWVTTASPASAAGTFNVKDYGATGNGSTNDAASINKAVTAANSAGGGTVEFPSGSYKVGSTIHLKSNVIIQLDSGSTLTGTSSGYDAPESNSNDSYQDYGHSHFHDAMFYGDGLSNIGFTGSGTIDGGGNFITGNPSSGQADKLISLTRCTNLTMDGITLKRAGHFAILDNGCNGISSTNLNIQTASDRDGWNVINTQNATFNNITVASNDDALVFKSDWALGQRFTQGNVTVNGAHLSAACCNALMFGSETCSDFTHYRFNDITITKSGKSGLGIVSMDGANISDVVYHNVTMSGTASPIMEKIGTRKRCGDSPGIGSISDIHYDGVTGTSAGSYSPTIWGQSGHQISNVTFNNVNLTLPGGHASVSDGVPSDNGDYNPNSIGTRPAYGWYIHQAKGISFTNSSVRFSSSDARPAVIANTGSNISFDHFTLQKGTASYDMGLQSVTGYCVTNTLNTSGGAARISTSGGSTESCGTPADDFSVSATPASRSVTAGSSTTYTVNTAVVTGSPGTITLSAGGLPSGATASFSPASVAPGSSSTLTVTTSASTPNGTSTVNVTGTSGSTTHSTGVGLTVTGGTGGGLTIGGLSVADSANAADWSVQSNLQAGNTLFGDRTFTVASVPSAVAGSQWIRTANDSKAVTTNPLVTFTISQSATVYVGVDTRVGKRSWMDSTWVDTGTQLTDTEGSSTRKFELYQKSFSAGSVALGPEGDTANSGSMYTVTVK